MSLFFVSFFVLCVCVCAGPKLIVGFVAKVKLYSLTWNFINKNWCVCEGALNGQRRRVVNRRHNHMSRNNCSIPIANMATTAHNTNVSDIRPQLRHMFASVLSALWYLSLLRMRNFVSFRRFSSQSENNPGFGAFFFSFQIKISLNVKKTFSQSVDTYSKMVRNIHKQALIGYPVVILWA